MIPVLLYSHTAEPVTQALLTSGLGKDLSLVKLSLSNLLKDTSIFDEINDDEVKIEWTLPSGEKIHNSENYYLLNRILSIPEELFEEFDSEDRTYSMSEFRGYLTFGFKIVGEFIASWHPVPHYQMELLMKDLLSSIGTSSA